MTRFTFCLTLALAVAFTASIATAGDCTYSAPMKKKSKDIVDTAVGAGNFKTLAAALGAARQAGREVRIIVKPEDIDDLASSRLARDIAKKIEETMQYPGQIKVTIIRETRAVDFAK